MDPPQSEPRRIVTLFPAATEMAFVLGAWDRVIGVSHACDFPEDMGARPRLTRSRLNGQATSRDIDQFVRRLADEGRSLYELDADALQALKPDLVVVQEQCRACAVTADDVRGALADLRPRPEIVSLGARTYEGVLDEMRRLGARLHCRDQAKQEALKQWGLAKEIRRRTQGRDRPRVAVLDWLDPPMFAGHWTKELAEMAGGEYTLVAKGEPSRTASWDELEEAEPDVIVAAPCGKTLEEAADELANAVRRHDLWDLAAVEQGRLFVADGNKYFNRPGPRLVYGAAMLARAMHWDHVPELPPAIESGLARIEIPRNPDLSSRA